MISPRSRSPRLSLLAVVALGATIAACSGADPGSIGSISHGHTGGTAGNTGSGAGSNGTGSNGGSANGATGGAGNGTPTAGGNGQNGGDTGSNGGNTGGTTGSDPGSGTTGGTTGGTPAAQPSLDVELDNAAPSIELASTSDVQVTVAAKDYSGAVTLSVSDLPTGVTGTFDNATVNVTSGAGATAKLSLKSLSSAAPAAAPFTITATAGSVTKTAQATLTVKSIITIKIPVNVDANPGPNVFGTINITAPKDIANNPVTVNFLNLDSTPHEIHAGNPQQGFPHGSGTFGQNQEDKPRKVIATGTFNFYLHDQGKPETPGTIIIK